MIFLGKKCFEEYFLNKHLTILKLANSLIATFNLCF